MRTPTPSDLPRDARPAAQFPGALRRTRIRWILPLAALLAGALAAQARGSAHAAGVWRILPAAPVDLASATTGVWTGREVLFTGPAAVGQRLAAALDVGAGTWRRLPGGPGPLAPVEGADRSVWTGAEWVIVGLGPGAAYRPSTNRWRRLPRAPGLAAAPVVVWSGSEVIAWGGGCCGDFSAAGAAYRPATNRWRRLPAAPLAGRQQATAVWTGREMIVFGGFADRTFPNGVTRDVTFRDAAAYNPRTDTWRKLPPMPVGRRAAGAVWTGRDVIVVGGLRPAAPAGTGEAPVAAGVFAYRPSTNRWRLQRPLPRGRWRAATVWTGSRLIVAGGIVRGAADVGTPSTLSHDPVRNTWSALAPMPGPGRTDPAAVWTGRELLIAGGLVGDVVALTP